MLKCFPIERDKNMYFANKEPFPPIKQKLHYFNLYKILW